MDIRTLSFSVTTNGFTDIIDITGDIQKKVNESGFEEGNTLVFVSGSTAGITTIEYEPGLLKDYPAFFESIAPAGKKYSHDDTWHDGNGYAHIRASLQGCSITVPFKDRKLLLGTWQQIILLDFDNTARKRNIVVQVTGK
jgi:secondary thiamine-phosphate synthase enzyme